MDNEASRRIVRRAELAAEIQRLRNSLSVMRLAQETSASTLKDHLTRRVKELSEKLEQMEREYHALNVEQIRDELANS